MLSEIFNFGVREVKKPKKRGIRIVFFVLSLVLQIAGCTGILYALHGFLNYYTGQIQSLIIIGIYAMVTALVIYILARRDYKGIKE